MNDKERQIVDFANTHLTFFFVLAMITFGVISRVGLRQVISGDMRIYLIEWYNDISEYGGLSSLSVQTGNYGIPYQTIIALLTYLPLPPVIAYKLVSCFFDIIVATIAGLLVARLSDTLKKKEHIIAGRSWTVNISWITFAIVFMSPIVILNSSAWGQCDSIFTSFCLLALYMLMQQKYKSAFVVYGVACAFKLQAVFLLPVLICYYFKERKFSIVHFLLIPSTMIVLSIGGIIQGRSVFSAFSIYKGQVGESIGRLTWNYPGLWALFSPEIKQGLNIYIIPATAMSLGIVGILLLYVWKNVPFTEKNLLIVSFLTVYLCVLTLPEMHERYGYLYEVMAIILAVIDKRTIPGCVLLHVLTFVAYSRYLAGTEYSIQVAAVCNILLFVMYLAYYCRNMEKCNGEASSTGASTV